MPQPPSLIEEALPTITTAPDLNTARLQQRADSTTTAPPELCGWVSGTSAYSCEAGQTCKFNTDYYAVGCCKEDNCDWLTTCCNYDPRETASWSGTVSECGGSGGMAGFCEQSLPYCGMYRFENGFTKHYCWDQSDALTDSVLFTSAGETTVRANLIKYTGSQGPASAIAAESDTVTVTVTASAAAPARTGNGSGSSSPSPGTIAGSVVGGAAFGAIVTLLAVLLTWYFRRRKEQQRQANDMNRLVPDQHMSSGGLGAGNGGGVFHGGATDPRYSVVPPAPPSAVTSSIGDGVSPHTQYSVPGSVQYSGLQPPHGTVIVGSPSPPAGMKEGVYLQQNYQNGVVTPVVEAPGGERNEGVYEMSAGR